MVERFGRRHVAEKLKRHRYKIAFLTTIGIIIAVIAMQLCYPKDRALPFALLRGEPAGGRMHADIAADIQRSFEAATVSFSTNKKTIKTTLSGLGANPNTDKMANELTDYPFWERFIPFSLLIKHPSVGRMDIYFDAKKLASESQRLAKKLTISATDAGIEVKNGQLVIEPAAVGSNVAASALRNSIADKQFNFSSTTVRVKAKEVLPKKADDSIISVKQQAEAVIAKDIIIERSNGKTFKPNKKTLASWLAIGVDKKDQYVLRIDDVALAKYVNQLNAKVRIDPGVTTVNLVDGDESDRLSGSVGREISMEKLAADLRRAALSKQVSETVSLIMRDVPSVVVNNRRYTESQKGLQAYVNYVTSTQDVYISLTQLNGKKWHVEARANESIPSGSTFKLYIAAVLFDEMKKGRIRWADPILDTDVAGCFERMTVASTNPCAEAWIAQFGRQYIDDFIHARGFSSGTTFVTNGTAVRTTANDLLKYMTKLHYGSLYGPEYRAKLLDSLGRHPYRYGIPTGSAGVVHDKVGFLWDYIHDTAIVERAEGTYIVTIMTRGQSYGRIAQITRELESIMYP